MLEKKELTFSKRRQLVKKEVADKLLESGELGAITGTNKTGYYTLSSIYKCLHPVLNKYDVDLDIVFVDSEDVKIIWTDCLTDDEKIISIDLTNISNRLQKIDKLPMMANVVQSFGAERTYFRRYILVGALNLPATDIIETGVNLPKGNNRTNNRTNTNKTNTNRTNTNRTNTNRTNTNRTNTNDKPKNERTINDKETLNLMDLVKKLNLTNEIFDKTYKALFKKDLSKIENILISEYETMVKKFNMRLDKIEKQKVEKQEDIKEAENILDSNSGEGPPAL